MLVVCSVCRPLLSHSNHAGFLFRKLSTLSETEILRRKMVEKIIRVDHAGEMGASFIYQGNPIKFQYNLGTVITFNVQVKWLF